MKVKAKSNEVENKIGTKFEGKDGGTEIPDSCPVCGEVFLPTVATAAVNEHINHCLDKSSKGSNGENDSGSRGGASLHCELVAHALKSREKEIVREQEENDEMFFCQICQKDLTRMNSQRRQQHMNSCCDKAAKLENTAGRQVTGTVSVAMITHMDQLTCPLCHKHFKSAKTRQAHIKRCAQKSNVPINQVLRLVHNQGQQLTAIPYSTSVAQDQNRAGNQASSVTTTTRRRRKQPSSKKNLDEETQLAMALSVSMAPPLEPKTKKSGRGARRKNKQVEEVPALCLRSEEEMKQVIATRAAQVICPQEDEDDEISSTPAMPPSNLLKQYNNQCTKTLPTDSSGASIDMTANTAGHHQHLNKDVGDTTRTQCKGADSDSEEVSKATNAIHVGGNSHGRTGDSCATRHQLSPSDLWGASFNSKSFLSFLRDDDDLEMFEPAPSKLNSSSCVLWSLTGLPADKSRQIFYVPGLLPQQPILKDKRELTRAKSTVKKPNTVTTTIQSSDSKVGLNEAAQTSVRPGNQPSVAEGEDISSAVHSDGYSADQLTASQMVNVEMLAELACSGSCNNATMATKKLGSVDDGDDDEVFASSGFCVPVVQDVEMKKECGYCRGAQSQLIQDLTTMICNPLFSDATIVAKNDQEFAAHRVILAARCKELGELLNSTSTTDENGKCWLYLREIAPEVLSIVLKFLYTGEIDFPQEMTASVKLVAERFKLTELDEACSDIAQKAIDSYGEFGESEVVHQSPDLNELVNKVMDDITNGNDQTINRFDELLNQDELGFDEDDIEEIRVFQTQAVREKVTKEGNNDGIRGVLEVMESTVIDCIGGNTGACEENSEQHEEVNYGQDTYTTEGRMHLSGKVSSVKHGENDVFAVSGQSETEEVEARLPKNSEMMMGLERQTFEAKTLNVCDTEEQGLRDCTAVGGRNMLAAGKELLGSISQTTDKQANVSTYSVSGVANDVSDYVDDDDKIHSSTLEKCREPCSNKTDKVQSVNSVSYENSKHIDRLLPTAVFSECENNTKDSGIAPSNSTNCQSVASENENNQLEDNDYHYYQFSDYEQQISFTDVDLETAEPDKMDTGVLDLEQMSHDEDVSLIPAEMSSNQRGLKDTDGIENVVTGRIELGSIDLEQSLVNEHDRHPSPLLREVDLDQQWLGNGDEHGDVKTVEMTRKNTEALDVERTTVTKYTPPHLSEVFPNEQGLEDVHEDYEDQAFGYQDLPSPPVASSEGESDDAHSHSDGEDALCLAHDESICLLSGDDTDLDKSLDEVEVNVVPETPSTTRKPTSTKKLQQKSNNKRQKESSPARHYAGDDCEVNGVNSQDSSDISWSAPSEHSGDNEASDFLSKLKNRADKGNKKNRKRKRDCSSTRTRPAKRRACNEKDEGVSEYPQHQNKVNSFEGFSCSEEEQDFPNKPNTMDTPVFTTRPLQKHSKSFSHSTPQRGLPSSSSPSHTSQTDSISGSLSPRSHLFKGLTSSGTSCTTLRGKMNTRSSQNVCSPAPSPNFPFSQVQLNCKPGGSISDDFHIPVLTPTQIKVVDESINQTFQTTDISVGSPSFMSPPVPSPEYSFTQMDSSEVTEVPVSTPPGDVLTHTSDKIMELIRSAGECVFSPLHPPPGSPEVSKVDTTHFISTPLRKIYPIASQDKEESPLSPSVPLSDHSQLSRNREKRTTTKSLSFSGSRNSKHDSTLIQSSGEESSSNDMHVEETDSPIREYRSDASKCSNHEETICTVNSDNEHTDEPKETQSKQSKLGEGSSIDVNVGLFQRLKAGKYGLNREFESDNDSESVNSDDGMGDRKNPDDAAAEQGHEGVASPLTDGVTKSDSHYAGDDDFFYEDGGYNCDNEFEVCDDPASDEDMLVVNTEKTEQSEKTPISLRAKNSNLTNRKAVKTVIRAHTSTSNLPARAVVAPSAGQTRRKGAKQAGKPLGEESKISTQQGGEVTRNVAKIPVTPMADYDNMDTPDLKLQLRRYGVRQLPKKKMVTKLKEIYHYTHQEPDAEENIFRGPPPKVPITKVSCVPRSQKHARDVQNQVQDSLSESEEESGSSRVRENSQGTGTETGTASSNQESGDESEEFGDVTMEIEDPSDNVTATQQVNGANLPERLREFITTNKELYLQVLKYKPLDLVAVHQRIKTSGIACSLGKLVDFLDAQGITFSTANTKPGGSRTRRRVKKNSQAKKNARTKR